MSGSSAKSAPTSSAAEQRQLKKDLARVEKQVAKGKERLAALLEEQERESMNQQMISILKHSLSLKIYSIAMAEH